MALRMTTLAERPESGVPQALSPLHCDVAQDPAGYVEPNIRVHHRLV